MVSLIISDVDGVLTDGRINIGEKGEAFKSFDVKDGLGIVRWIESGGEFALVTARESDAVSHRATELNIDRVYQNVSDKVRQIEQIASDVGVSLDDIAYIGDDTSDVPAIEAAGVGGAPADASPSARRAADHVCANDGGHGAIREFVDYLDDDSDEVLGVIPARYGSTRFPGKPLANIAGKPMIEHVYERATAADELNEVVVATDDERIYDCVESFGGSVVMTSNNHSTGTDRVAAVARERAPDITVNIQGDEPLIDSTVIDETVAALKRNTPRMATPVSVIENEAALNDENTVKVVTDINGRALYFSRSRIPSKAGLGEATKHIGLYAFETDLLLEYVGMDSSIERQEDLEQLRLLENGGDIQTVAVDYDAKEVNTEADIEVVEAIIEEHDA